MGKEYEGDWEDERESDLGEDFSPGKYDFYGL